MGATAHANNIGVASYFAAEPLAVFAIIEEAQTTRECLAVAAIACSTSANATLTALHIQVDPAKIRTAPEEISIQQMREQHEGTAHDRAVQTRRIFEFWADSNPEVHAIWHETVGTISASLQREAQDADLIVIPRPHNMDSADALHAAIFDLRKLVLFVPESGSRRFSRAAHLAIAWKSRPHTLRAINQTLRFLRCAEHVTVISVEGRNDASDTREVVKILAENGIATSELRTTSRGNERVADCLLREADRIGAGGLVLGAYRFGEVLEWVFGGVTREILEKTHLPIFLMH